MSAVIVLEFASDVDLGATAGVVLARLAQEPKVAGLVGGHLAVADDAARVLAVFS